MHIAIQIDLEEIEQVLRQHWASTHGFDLKSFQWEVADDQDTKVVCIAEKLEHHAAPPPPPLEINEAMVTRNLGDLFQQHIQFAPPLVAAPAAAPATAPTLEQAAALAPPFPPPAPPAPNGSAPPERKIARTALGHAVSWLENPEEAPHHPADTADKIAARVATLRRARQEAGGVDGTDGHAEEMFDPMNPPDWADTEKH